MDGEDIQGPSNPIKEKIVDFECNIKQQSILSNKLMVQEIVTEITNLAWNYIILVMFVKKNFLHHLN